IIFVTVSLYQNCLLRPRSRFCANFIDLFISNSHRISSNFFTMITIYQLPEYILLQIFHLLPFKDRIRAGEVNSIFRCISCSITSEMKLIDLNDEIFKQMTVEFFSLLISRCYRKLVSIHFPYDDRDVPMAIELSKFTCPRLTELDMIHVVDIDQHTFHEL